MNFDWFSKYGLCYRVTEDSWDGPSEMVSCLCLVLAHFIKSRLQYCDDLGFAISKMEKEKLEHEQNPYFMFVYVTWLIIFLKNYL